MTQGDFREEFEQLAFSMDRITGQPDLKTKAGLEKLRATIPPMRAGIRTMDIELVFAILRLWLVYWVCRVVNVEDALNTTKR